MKTIYSVYGNPGSLLSPRDRASLFFLLGVDSRKKRQIYLWRNPLRGDPVQATHLMSTCHPKPIPISSFLNEKSLLETLPHEEVIEDESILPISEDMDEESQLTETFMNGSHEPSEEDGLVELKFPNVDTDEGTEVEVAEVTALLNQEIINIFQREFCAEDGKCKSIHFFISEGTVMGEKGKKLQGYHIAPGDPLTHTSVSEAFGQVFNRAIVVAQSKH